MKSFFKIISSITIVYIIVFSFNKIIANQLKKNINENLSNINTVSITNQSFETKNLTLNCERELFFDSNNLCFPKIENWKECRIDKNLKSDIDNLELNNKILAFYIPFEIYEKSKTEKIANYPVISFFVQLSTIGMKTTKEALPMVFKGLKNSFEVQDWKYIQDLLKTKSNAEFIKPVLFDSYDITNKVKTCVTINSSKFEGKVNQRVSFINILDLKERIVILNYSKEIGKNFQYSKMKDENSIIVKRITETN
jgi:hypothetical protein